jgi:hypothetical protein
VDIEPSPAIPKVPKKLPKAELAPPDPKPPKRPSQQDLAPFSCVRRHLQMAEEEAKGSDALMFPSHLLESGGGATGVVA